MALFSTPKSVKAKSKAKAEAKAKANERGKPRDVGEKYEVKRRLKEKYPQMYEKGWGKPKKSEGGKGLTGINKKQYDALSPDDKKAIDKAMGRK